MFWDKVSGLYDLFETIYNGKVYRNLGKKVAEKMLRQAWKKCRRYENVKLENPYAAIKEMERVCKAGGKLIIPTYINASDKTNRKAVRLLELAGV